MITVTIPEAEQFDEATGCFIKTKKQTLVLEHSLLSISKWESKWKKPFISDAPRTVEETLDYIRCMTITSNVDPEVYKFIPPNVIKEVTDYINDPMTATWFNERPGSARGKSSGEAVTSELIYYWMIALTIPMSCEKWHLNRLLTLIRVCQEKNEPSKKMGKGEIMRRNKSLNDARRRALHSKG